MAGLGEVYLPAFALALGIRPVLAGLVATLPLLVGGMLQLAAPRAIARVPSLRGWVATLVVVQALALVPLVVLALAGGPATPIVFGAASLYWAAGMGSAAGWNPWMSRVVPARLRTRFFSRRQGIVQAAMLVGLVGGGIALEGAAGTRHVRQVYAAMFALALLARLGSAAALFRQGGDLPRVPLQRVGLRALASRLRGTPRVPVLGFLVAAIAGAAVCGPFLTPFLLVHDQIGYASYSVFTATVVIVKIAALPVLGRLIQRVGVKRVLAISAIAIAPIPLLWPVSRSLAWLLAAQAYCGLAWAGFDLGMLISLFDGADDAERTTTQVAFSALQAMGTAGASLAGGALLISFGGHRAAYVLVFAASAIARLAAAALLVRRLPLVLARLPLTVMTRAWTLAIRPWGGTLVRPIADTLERWRDD